MFFKLPIPADKIVCSFLSTLEAEACLVLIARTKVSFRINESDYRDELLLVNCLGFNCFGDRDRQKELNEEFVHRKCQNRLIWRGLSEALTLPHRPCSSKLFVLLARN